MKDFDDLFRAEKVENQVESFADQRVRMTPGVSVVHALKQMYAEQAQEESLSLQRAWQRIVSARQDEARQTTPEEEIMLQEVEMERATMRSGFTRPRRKTLQMYVGMVAAVIFTALLVGSMVMVLNTAHEKGATNAGPVVSGVLPNILQATRTNSVSRNHPLQSWTITNVQAVQRLYRAIYALPKSPTLHPTACPMTDDSEYHLSFFHNKTVIQKVLVPGGCGGLVVIGAGDARMWNPQFGVLFAQTLGITKPLPL